MIKQNFTLEVPIEMKKELLKIPVLTVSRYEPILTIVFLRCLISVLQPAILGVIPVEALPETKTRVA